MNLEERDNIKVDLHIHTTASDGTWTPQELIKNIIENNIDVFSVTDHDSVENIAEIKELVKNTNIVFIPGVEINTMFNGRNYHILGYGIDSLNTNLQEIMSDNKKKFEYIDYESIRLLTKKYKEFSLEEFEEYIHDKTIGGWKAYSYILKKGICKNPKDYFKLFEQGELKDLFENLEIVSPLKAIEIIKQANGIPVLAHPGASFYHTDIKEIIALFVERGIMGLECYHPNNSQEITNYCLEVCKKKGLMITGGSDCHGDFLENRKLGTPDIRLSQLNFTPNEINKF